MPSQGPRISPRASVIGESCLGRSIIGASLFILALAAPAAADRYRGAPADPTYPQVTVPSQYDSSDTVSGAVWRTPRGDDVRLPGGTWVPCGFNCYFTLRNATVDFWRRYDVFPQ
jgi:hypothetical protein